MTKKVYLKKDSNDEVIKLKKKIDKIVSKNSFKLLTNIFSNISSIPKNLVDLKLKRLLYNSHDWQNKQAPWVWSGYLINFLYFFLGLILVIASISFIKKKVNNNRFKLIIDNVEQNAIFVLYKKLINNLKNVLIISENNFKINRYNSLGGTSALFIRNSYDGNRIFLINFLFKTFYYSIKYRINFSKLFLHLTISFLKYSNIFYQNRSYNLIYNRIYLSCPIRNFIFKKYGGKKILCIQSHIHEGSVLPFSDVDIYCTFGKEKNSLKKIKYYGGSINSQRVIGSLKMETELGKKINNNLKPIDILFIGINLADWVYLNKQYHKNYYRALRWLGKLSNDFPSLNIIYKHHTSFKEDKLESQIFSKKNIKIISKDKKFSSYHFMLKSKILLSFASTMILEGIGIGKKAYFLDPELKSYTFFSFLKFCKKIRIKSYKELKKIIKLNINKKRFKKNLSRKNYCLSSLEVTKKITKLLK